MKVVLAYSGGLDTSVCIKLLQEKYKAEVITVTCDVGQHEDLDEAGEKAKKLGVKKHLLLDVKEELAQEYLFKAVKANALYEDYYPLHSALHRYLIVKKVVEIAKQEKAEAVAHGNTGLGNDQMRYDITFKAFAPELKVLAPIREMNLTREQEIDYCIKKGIPVNRPKDKPYSIDENLWGCFVGDYGDAEDPTKDTPEDIFRTVVRNPKGKESLFITIDFESGVPIGINGQRMTGVELIQKIRDLVGGYGYGWVDFTEDTVVGTKIRQTYESPAAFTLIKAHLDLEKLVLTKRELTFKHFIDKRWAELIFDGLWVEPLRSDLESFIEETQKVVTGSVKIMLLPNMIMPVSRTSPNSLYIKKLTSYGPESGVRQIMGQHFTELWGAGSIVAYQIRKEKNEKPK
ncbi:MAG: argininosuccinate synthase [Nitrospirae bacterium]|nr:argininosuccinate synthase [Nitrospirota bacterium]